MKAGFDGVEVHGANGYLLDQFLCTGTTGATMSTAGPEHRICLLLVRRTYPNRYPNRNAPEGARRLTH
jgi:NADH:flavin oxidoreductase / NADH oxidase family